MNRKEIFFVYNVLKKDSKTIPTISLQRLNKALGLAQSKNSRPYYTTIESCTCPDATQRDFYVCKHRLALMMHNSLEVLQMRFDGEGPWDQKSMEVSNEQR